MRTRIPTPVLVLVLAGVLNLWNLGGFDLGAPDEPYFAEGAREMVADGHWLVPHVNGVVTTDKPPLFFWLIAGFSLPQGLVTSWTARLPSALAAMATVGLTLRLGTRLLGPQAGVLSGLILTTAYLPWDKARSAQIDAVLCFFILIALSAFEAYRAGEAGRGAGLLFWAAAALAVLAKGPVGLLLPLGIALATLATDRRLGTWRGFAPIAGPLLFAAMVAAWIAAAALFGESDYSVWSNFKVHFVERAVFGMHHRQPPWYFAKVMPVNLLPWTGIVAGGVVLAVKRRADPALRLLLVWAAFVVVFFSISTEKRSLYVLPAYPALALLAAAQLKAVVWPEGAAAIGRRWVTISQAILGLLLCVVGLGLPFVAPRAAPELAGEASALAGAMLVGGVVVLACILRGRVLASVLATAAVISVVYLVAATTILPAAAAEKSARSFALEVRRATEGARAAGERALAFCAGNVPKAIAFYSDGLYLRETCDPQVLAAHLQRGPDAYAVVNAAKLGELDEPLRKRLVVSASDELSRMTVQLVHLSPERSETSHSENLDPPSTAGPPR